MSYEIQNKFDAPFDNKEVKIPLFKMHPTKSLGLDGCSTHFFQRNWDMCGDEVLKEVMRVLCCQMSIIQRLQIPSLYLFGRLRSQSGLAKVLCPGT